MNGIVFLETIETGGPPSERPPPRLNLATGEDIKREMARVYRETRNRTIEATDATKLVFILTQILRAHEVACLEKRLAYLEKVSPKCL